MPWKKCRKFCRSSTQYSRSRGLVGRKIKRVVEVEAAPVSQAPTTNSLPAPFSRAEIQQTLEVLAQVQKIIQSI